jgi:hypothetical protein
MSRSFGRRERTVDGKPLQLHRERVLRRTFQRRAAPAEAAYILASMPEIVVSNVL